MRQRGVGHGHFIGEQDAHRHARRALHEAGGEVPLHRQVIHLQRRMKMPAPRGAAGGAAGHEDAFGLRRRLAAQLQRLESIDGHGRDITPGLDRARAGATALAKAAERIGCVLVGKKTQRELVKLVIGAAIHCDECKQVCDQRIGLVHVIPSRAVTSCSEGSPHARNAAHGRELALLPPE